MPADLLIRNAMIYDGSGNKPYIGSLKVEKDVITAVGPSSSENEDAREIVDAHGMALCPGFVDTHTHSDMVLLHDGRMPASVAQGVTTEILGQDGLSYAPMSRKNLEAYAPYLKGLDGLFEDVSLDFETVPDYLAQYRGRIGVNVAWLVPHCALRLETAGFDNRLLTMEEEEKAAALAKHAIMEGACGFSTGLSYYPGAFSDTHELISVCRAVKEAGGVYVTHLRSVFRAKQFSPVEEALKIAEASGVKLHFSHFRTGGDTIGCADTLLAPIDKAVNAGMDITLELYPYPYGASYAPMFVPMWANDGGMEKILERLENPIVRRKIAEEIDAGFPQFDGVITYAGSTSELMGKTFGHIAQKRRMSKGTVIAELLYTEKLALSFHDINPHISAEQQELFEEDVLSMLQRPYYMVGSDGIRIGKWPHPRGAGSFARLWCIARKHGFPYETLVERLSALPCRRFGLKNRGMLHPGYFADLVLLDPRRICDRATDECPLAPPDGVMDCWINGIRVLQEGKLTDALAGRVLLFNR